MICPGQVYCQSSNGGDILQSPQIGIHKSRQTPRLFTLPVDEVETNFFAATIAIFIERNNSAAYFSLRILSDSYLHSYLWKNLEYLILNLQ